MCLRGPCGQLKNLQTCAFGDHVDSHKNFKNVFDVISEYIVSSFENKTGSLYESITARKFDHFKTEHSYKTVLNIIDNRVFKRVCILLKDSGNDELVKEL